MTSSNYEASNKCKTREKEFEKFLIKEFRKLELDYDGLTNVLNKIKKVKDNND